MSDTESKQYLVVIQPWAVETRRLANGFEPASFFSMHPNQRRREQYIDAEQRKEGLTLEPERAVPDRDLLPYRARVSPEVYRRVIDSRIGIRVDENPPPRA